MKRALLFLAALLSLAFYVNADTDSSDVARIHIVANSDSSRDIAVKREVAEAVRELLKSKSFDGGIRQGLDESLAEVEKVSNYVLMKNGAAYSAKAFVETRYFEKRTLQGSVLPEGEYLALTVTLGEGEGHNWWSVIFPGISLEASLAVGEEGSDGKTAILGNGEIVKIRCLIFDLCKIVLTKH